MPTDVVDEEFPTCEYGFYPYCPLCDYGYERVEEWFVEDRCEWVCILDEERKKRYAEEGSIFAL